MSTHTESVDVNRPIRMVYDQWTQFESFPQFMEGVERIDQRDDTHPALGDKGRRDRARVRCHRYRAASRRAGRLEVRQRSQPRRRGLPFHRLDDEKTRVTAQMDVDPEGFVENVADKLGILKTRINGDLKRFKEFIESRPGETGAWRGDVSRPDA